MLLLWVKVFIPYRVQDFLSGNVDQRNLLSNSEKIPPPSSLAASKSFLWAHFIANSLAFIIKRIVESVYCKKETKVNSDLILHTTIQPILVEDMIFFSVLQRILAWMFADSDSQFFCCLLGCWGFPDWVVSYTILAEDCILYNFSWRLYPIQF